MDEGKYRYIDRTPMRFHQFVRFVRLPLSVLLVGVQLVCYPSTVTGSWHPLYTIYMIFMAVLVATALVAFVALLRWSKVGWLTVMVCSALDVAYALYGFGVYAWFDAIDASLVGRAIGTIAMNTIIMVYYAKRKQLFDRYPESLHAPVDAGSPAV